ncbi:MAG: SUMF1/EgtB/PvdO family nonheme iron enzyme [Elusimicrobiota bacterium]
MKRLNQIFRNSIFSVLIVSTVFSYVYPSGLHIGLPSAARENVNTLSDQQQFYRTLSSPTNLQVIVLSASQIRLMWKDNSNNEYGFIIERKEGVNGTYAQVGTVGANVAKYDDTGLTEGTQYYYRVRSYNGDHDSIPTSEESVTPATIPDGMVMVPAGNFNVRINIGEIIVDSIDAACVNNGFEDERTFYPSGSYYGRGYHRASGISGGTLNVVWNIVVPVTGNYNVYGWWAAGTNRASNAPYIITHASGTFTYLANQQANNGSWMKFGTYQFNKGTTTIVQTNNANGYVLADAVRLLNADPNSIYSIQPVYLSSFFIDKYEVTNEQYKQFIDTGGYSNSTYWSTDGWAWKNNLTQPSYWTDTTYGYTAVNGPRLPVVGVSWYEADAYARWAGKRLPTEAEWEKAARGTDLRAYPWGDTWYVNYCNWYDNSGKQDGYSKTAPVGIYESGQSLYGCYDLAGNVSEWCSDWFGASYPWVYINPTGPASGTNKILRGGSYASTSAACKADVRSCADYKIRETTIGFRCVK